MAKMLQILIPTKLDGIKWDIDSSAVYAPLKVGNDIIGFIDSVNEKKGVMSARIWASNLGIGFEDAEAETIGAIYLKNPDSICVGYEADFDDDFDI